MKLKWLGHSCFLLTDEAGTRLMMDPCDPTTGYVVPPTEVDAVTASHGHHDHNYFNVALGDPVRITDAGEHMVKGVRITGIPAWHDEEQGAKRGPNIMYLVEMDGIRLLHVGDLGHQLDAATLAAIGPVDVLLVPIGGVFTIDAAGARAVTQAVNPKVLVPMHYKTEQLSFNLGELGPFLDSLRGCSIHRMRQNEATLSADSLGSDRVLVLEYKKPE